MTTQQNNKWSWLADAGMILIVVALLLPLLGTNVKIARWIYSAGALITLAGRLLTPYHGDSIRVKRLHRIQAWSAIFFCVSAFFMFYPGAGAADWLAFTLAGGAIVIYTSIMIPLVERKEQSAPRKNNMR